MKRAGFALALLAVLIVVGSRYLGHAGAQDPHRDPAELLVSSPADAGPGSLRDAILAADRRPQHARILLNVARIGVESPLPTLVNPRGIDIVGAPGGTLLDATRQHGGATLQIRSDRSLLKGFTVAHAADRALLVIAVGVGIEAMTFEDCATGISVAKGSDGLTVRGSSFIGGRTAIEGDGDLPDTVIVHNRFSANTRAAIWLVGPPAGAVTARRSIDIAENTFEGGELGVVLGNHAALVQKNHFSDTKGGSILVLSGAATIVENQIDRSTGPAISITDGAAIAVSHNVMTDNHAIAIMLRNSGGTLDHNVLKGNGYGIVAVYGAANGRLTLNDNSIARTAADGITVMGGSPLLARNEITGSRGAGLRVLDLEQTGEHIKGAPQLDANVLHDNVIDGAPP